MEGIKTNQHVLALAAAIIGCWLVISVKGQNGQINTPCTSSMMTTLTPCLNYITGSRPGGSTGASITECCGAFTSLMSNSMDCACLLVTASVPLPLSLSIPKICNTPLALQCKGWWLLNAFIYPGIFEFNLISIMTNNLILSCCALLQPLELLSQLQVQTNFALFYLDF